MVAWYAACAASVERVCRVRGIPAYHLDGRGTARVPGCVGEVTREPGHYPGCLARDWLG
ncbi:MAG: hypothetical protein IPJ15_16665 [Actinomycetales bacterium]|nr:hypothetical protein [Candidatus Phosphoribacter baldrii]HRC13768.1 hypothetical protein [Dermatophilaceae bacterium]